MSAVLRTFSSRIRHTLRKLRGGSTPFLPDPVEIDGLLARCHASFPADADLAAAWERLWHASPAATTFTSPTWQHRGIAPTLPPDSLRLLTVQRGPDLLAVLPLQRTASGFLESTGYAVSDYLDPLLSADDEQATTYALLTLLRRLWTRDLKAVTLHNIRPESSFRHAAEPLACECGWRCEQTITSNSACICLPDSWERYLQSLDPHERKELRRKMRKAQDQAGAHLRVFDEHLPDESQLPGALDLIEAADPSKRQWLQANVRPLLLRIGPQLMREGRLRLLMLFLHDRPAACLMEFPSWRGPMLFNSGFDPAFRHLSPGAVTFGLAIRRAIEQRHAVFDMLRGQEAYKYRLGAVDHPLYRLSLHPRQRQSSWA